MLNTILSPGPRRRRAGIACVIGLLVIAAIFGGLSATGALSSGSKSGHAPLPPSLASAAVRDAGLLAGSGAWALTADRVALETTDGGAWTDVTPAGVNADMIRSAMFLNAQDGWVAVSGPDATNGAVPLLVYRTSDGGHTWAISKADESVLLADSARGPARFSFTDPRHGWLEADMASSGSFSDGNLYRTADGGATWTKLRIPIAGSITFVSTEDGFITGGVEGNQLYATHDGGVSWTPVSLPSVAGTGGEIGAIAGPRFANSATGVLTVTYTGASGATVAFDQTTDGGASWALARSVPVPGNASGGTDSPVAITGRADWIAATGPGPASLKVAGSGATVSTLTGDGLPSGDLGRVISTSFQPRASRGLAVVQGGICEGFKTDCHEFGALFSTANGGATWQQLTP
jgi:photosystem II stability/assembly factor-like uncharacterized protein